MEERSPRSPQSSEHREDVSAVALPPAPPSSPTSPHRAIGSPSGRAGPSRALRPPSSFRPGPRGSLFKADRGGSKSPKVPAGAQALNFAGHGLSAFPGPLNQLPSSSSSSLPPLSVPGRRSLDIAACIDAALSDDDSPTTSGAARSPSSC